MARTESRRPGAELPAWPVYLLFAGFPVWWVLGLAAFAAAGVAVIMLVLLVERRQFAMPPAFALWVLFLAWTVVAATQLDFSKLIGFAVRFGTMAGCGVLFVYIYNARAQLDTRKVLLALALFFAFVVCGGYLGVLVPHGSITTIAERLLPASIRRNEYVTALVHPPFAEAQHPYGSPTTFYRPSAPFPYTNSWGCNVALLVPCAAAAFATLRTRRGRVVLAAVLALAVVPAFTSLNRGLFIGLGVAAAYVAIRFAWRGHLVPLVSLGGIIIAGIGVAVASGFWANLNERLHYSESNTGRSTIYRESFQGALDAPLFGNGAPRASQTVGVAIGSQGHIWNLMFSYGFVALGLFLLWFLVATWVGRRMPGQAGIWLSAVLVVALVSFVYYGYDGMQLAVIMAVAALVMREASPPGRAARSGHSVSPGTVRRETARV